MIEIYTDNAPGERRTALVEDGKIVELHLHRGFALMHGETGEARVIGKSGSGNFLKGPAGQDILMRGIVQEGEGRTVPFRITREAIAEPGLMKLAEARRWVEGDPVNDAETLWAARVPQVPLATCGATSMSDTLAKILTGAASAGRGHVSYQRTKAGLVFDVDGEGDPMALNIAAAVKIANLLRLYQVGGMVMIDFVSVDSKASRIAVAEAFDLASKSDPRGFERSAINGFGMMQVVRARLRPSVLDMLFGTNINSVSTETQAMWLLRTASLEPGFGQRTITAQPAVAQWLLSPLHAELVKQVERGTGAPLAIVADRLLTGYGHVHASQA